ncbi:hypothetical protein C2I36_13475 [Rhodobacteraceae bacterium WD3A24]|nr:hypothetical protein C2I36_13475 [Rhodobacteraceae bacterium WD3A24]
MQDDTPPDGADDPRDLVAAADSHFHDTAEVLTGLIDEIKAGSFGPAKELAQVLANLRRALDATFQERARLERYRQNDPTSAGAGAPHPALDLDAARDEIGRRLARLRAAGDGG